MLVLLHALESLLGFRAAVGFARLDHGVVALKEGCGLFLAVNWISLTSWGGCADTEALCLFGASVLALVHIDEVFKG